MIDANYKAWLIEINSNPSLARGHQLDGTIKDRLIEDTIDVLDPLYFNPDALVSVLKRRLSDKPGPQNVGALNSDLYQILDGKTPRKYGEPPKRIGSYEYIAPSPSYDALMKLAYPHKYS